MWRESHSRLGLAKSRVTCARKRLANMLDSPVYILDLCRECNMPTISRSLSRPVETDMRREARVPNLNNQLPLESCGDQERYFADYMPLARRQGAR